MKIGKVLVAALAIANLSAPSFAGDMTPAILELDGSNAIALPPDESLDLEVTGTIEFWVAAKWDEALDYDPAILADMGAEGPRYSVHITADKQALGLFSGDEWETAPFDFSDGKLHFVSLTTYDGITEVSVDGELRGILSIGYAEEIIGAGFFIGTVNGVASPFVGSLAGLRIWDTAVDEEDLIAFSAKDILSKEGKAHPDFDTLVAVGVFDDGGRTVALTREPSSHLDLAAELIDASEAGDQIDPEADTEDLALPEEAAEGPHSGAEEQPQ